MYINRDLSVVEYVLKPKDVHIIRGKRQMEEHVP